MALFPSVMASFPSVYSQNGIPWYVYFCIIYIGPKMSFYECYAYCFIAYSNFSLQERFYIFVLFWVLSKRNNAGIRGSHSLFVHCVNLSQWWARFRVCAWCSQVSCFTLFWTMHKQNTWSVAAFRIISDECAASACVPCGDDWCHFKEVLFLNDSSVLVESLVSKPTVCTVPLFQFHLAYKICTYFTSLEIFLSPMAGVLFRAYVFRLLLFVSSWFGYFSHFHFSCFISSFLFSLLSFFLFNAIACVYILFYVFAFSGLKIIKRMHPNIR